MQESTKLNYVEFASLDIRRSKAFFESAFGWCFTDYGSEYSAFSNAGMDGGIFSAQRVMRQKVGRLYWCCIPITFLNRKNV